LEEYKEGMVESIVRHLVVAFSIKVDFGGPHLVDLGDSVSFEHKLALPVPELEEELAVVFSGVSVHDRQFLSSDLDVVFLCEDNFSEVFVDDL